MSKFKAGDKIRFLGSPYVMKDFKVGHEYLVGGKYHENREGSLGVVCDESGEENGYPEEFFELVSSGGPVRTVTRKEIVPGVYANVEVGSRDNEWLSIPVSLKRSNFTRAELTVVINTLTEVRDAMVGK